MTGRRLYPRLVVGFLGGLLGVAALGYAVTDTALGWLIPLTLVGGGAIGVLLIALRPTRHPTFTPDRFSDDPAAFLDMMNISHVRVAGIGGLGLVIVALIVSVQYQLLTAVMIAGLVGGAVGAGAVILYRSRHDPA